MVLTQTQVKSIDLENVDFYRLSQNNTKFFSGATSKFQIITV